MPQSLVRNYVHLIWSTKYRQPFITKDIQEKLWNYTAGIYSNLECKPLAIGGVEDHIHSLIRLTQKKPLMKILEIVKSNSSGWMKTKGEAFKEFYWQDGYGAFSVNPRDIQVVIDYINRQEEHHRKKGFKEEYLGFLKQYQVEYDERYLWD